jgi:hypothetical protein
MKAPSSAVVLALTVAIPVALAPDRTVAGETLATNDGYWQCQNAPIETTAFLSEIFEMNAAMGAVQSAFAQLLSTKYGFKGQVSCGMAYKGPTILAKLKDDHARYVKQLNQQGIKVVETGWTYAGGS